VKLDSLRLRKKKSEFECSINKRHFDVAIMGGGSGGISCALAASKKGLSVIVFDYVEPSA
jgi:thioredoxin reductase (NADPH)